MPISVIDFTDLMIFNEEDVVSSDGIYDYIEPKHFVKFDKTKGTLAAFPAKLVSIV